MRPGLRFLVTCCMVVAVMPTQASYGAEVGRESALPGLPEGMQEASDLTCPSSTMFIGLAFPGDGAVAVGTGDRSTSGRDSAAAPGR